MVVLDLPAGRRPRDVPVNPGALVTVRHTGPAPAPVPSWNGPDHVWRNGPHRLELGVTGGRSVRVTDLLTLTVG